MSKASDRRSRHRVLWWSTCCFVGLAVTNVLTFVDLVLVPQVDLHWLRAPVGLVALVLLVIGLVWDTVTLAGLATLLDGAQVMAALVIALCFWKLGSATGDRLYYAFGAAFVLLATSTVLIGLGIAVRENSALAFVPRLLAFLTSSSR